VWRTAPETFSHHAAFIKAHGGGNKNNVK